MSNLSNKKNIKIKPNFMLRKVASSWMAIPVGTRTSEMSGIIALNETAAFLWEFFQQEHTREDAVEALLLEYEVDRDTAVLAVDNLMQKLEKEGLLEL